MKTTTGTAATTLLSSSFLSYPPPSSTTDITYWASPLACIAQLHVVLQQALMDVTTRMTENTKESSSRNEDGITNNNTTTTFSSVSFPSSFDKDHDGAMLFVTAASNLRNLVFSIQPIQSIYSTKGIAGNIIPAIATTNAIAAGLQMLQVYRVMEVLLAKKKKQQQQQQQNQKSDIDLIKGATTTTKQQPPQQDNKDNVRNSSRRMTVREQCRYNNILRNPTRNGLAITAIALEPPNPNCFVCRHGTVEFHCNTNIWTLQRFVERVLQRELGLQDPSITIGGSSSSGSSGGVMIWEQGQGSDQELFQINWNKTLSKLPGGGIQHGTIVHVDDYTQSLELNIHVAHQKDPFLETKKNGSGGGGGVEKMRKNNNNKKEEEEEGGTMMEEFPFLLKGSSLSGATAATVSKNKKDEDAKVAASSKINNDDGNDNNNDDDDDDDVVVVVKKKDKRKAAALSNNKKDDKNDHEPNVKRHKNNNVKKEQDLTTKAVAAGTEIILID